MKEEVPRHRKSRKRAECQIHEDDWTLPERCPVRPHPRQNCISPLALEPTRDQNRSAVAEDADGSSSSGDDNASSPTRASPGKV